MNTRNPNTEKGDLADGPKITHQYNYMSPFSYKKKSKELAGEARESVVMTSPGQARPVVYNPIEQDMRVGIYPQHNSHGDFHSKKSVLEAITFETYAQYIDSIELERCGFEFRKISLTKKKLKAASDQFAHLSREAFRQMMCIFVPDKRDFEIWVKHDEDTRTTQVAFTNDQSGFVQFVQTIERGRDGTVKRLQHCMFDSCEPFVINETIIDEDSYVRQVAHVGAKGDATALNALERFDDGTVTWTVTNNNESGTAALKPSGEVVILGVQLNEASKLAARNLGAEGLDANDSWTGEFSLQACMANDHPMQKDYKDAVRKQVWQIVDGAAVPGLNPIFDV